MAMRAQADQTPAPVEEESELSSPGASTTVIGGFSSCRIQMQGGTDSWCTLPRTFIEHQVQVIVQRVERFTGEVFKMCYRIVTLNSFL